MTFPFRFGIHLWSLPNQDWRAKVRRYEDLGFSTITLTDHLVVPQWEPFTALSAIAAVTERVGVGTLVLDTPLRDPVLTAKSAATLDLLSSGRFELGLGAGYVAANFAAAGRPFEPIDARLARLEEAIGLMQSLWSETLTTFGGRFYEVADAPMVATEPVRPRILIGGGGRQLLGMGGRLAESVSMIPRQGSGEWSAADSIPDSSLARTIEKQTWVAEGAAQYGRDPSSIELNTMVVKVIVGDDPHSAVESEAAASGVTPEQLSDSSLYLCGTGDEVRDHLDYWREQTGISYFSLFDPGDEQIEYLAEHVVGPLSGR